MALCKLGSIATLVVAIPLAAGCSKNSTPPPTSPTTRATVGIAAISVVGERASAGGYTYRVVLHLRESAGVAATISAVDLAFTNGANPVMSSHHEQTIPTTANVVPSNGAADTRELVTTDTNAAGPYATSVLAKVTYTGGTSGEATVNGSAAVPALSEPPPPVTYTLRGIITDQETGRGIEGARVEALNGANAGKATLTDNAGAYALTGLLAENFRMRASAVGYDQGEQNVTVPDITRADLALRRPVTSSCAYTVAPTGILDVPRAGGQFGVTITRTSGTCAWQATTDVSWITLVTTSGNGDATLSFAYLPNATFVGRIGVVRVAWSGGSAQLTVRQPAETPAFCLATITVNGQNPLGVPASGGQFTASIAPVAGVPPGICGPWTADTMGTAISFVGPTSGVNVPASVTFSVPANSSPTVRTMFVVINFLAGTPSALLTVNQSGGP
jgi:hypothetical protein